MRDTDFDEILLETELNQWQRKRICQDEECKQFGYYAHCSRCGAHALDNDEAGYFPTGGWGHNYCRTDEDRRLIEESLV